MSKLNIGDKVRIIDDEKERIYTVEYIDKHNIIELKELGSTYLFSKKALKLVERCPYKTNDQVELIAVFWSEEKKCFSTWDIAGVVDDHGFICFDERIRDHDGVLVSHLNIVRTADEMGVDYDCAFCEPGEENMRKVKLEYLRIMASEVKSLKEDYKYAHSQLTAMYQQIVQ